MSRCRSTLLAALAVLTPGTDPTEAASGFNGIDDASGEILSWGSALIGASPRPREASRERPPPASLARGEVAERLKAAVLKDGSGEGSIPPHFREVDTRFRPGRCKRI
jgi:hypothetical protein